MKKVYYPALIDKAEDSDFGVSFHGCVCAGETLEDVILGAEEALAGHIARNLYRFHDGAAVRGAWELLLL